ncbi:MAG: DUF2059 domain-containing protein [Halioglobus sp.]
MKQFRTIVLLGLFSFSSLAIADAASEKQAEILLSKLKMKNAMEQSMTNLIDLQVQQQPALGPFRGVMQDFFSKYMSYESLKPDMVKIYAEAFTANELKEINAFYETDTGKKTLEVMPTLMGQGGQLGAQRVQSNMGELREMIEAEAQRLQAEQQPAPATTPEAAQ